ncbi:hypothetical protein DV738_g4580, partial [Chaetothyriales sp. CBS 135597]
MHGSLPPAQASTTILEEDGRPLDNGKLLPGEEYSVQTSGLDSTLVEIAEEPPQAWPDFSRWRPGYHLQSPNGWMNDPCGPGYDPSTGLYHMFFQWNPTAKQSGTVVWGSMHWGHASSKDMVNWTVDAAPALTPGPWYDHQGCFTGCLVPSGLNGQLQQLTLIYTGVTTSLLHYSLPYIRQSETLAVARSTDGGATWARLEDNPILVEPPEGLSVLGWRDPFVASWPAMDSLLRVSEPALYGMISGGIKDRGPTLFLYAVDAKDMSKWSYLSTFIDMPLNYEPSIWSGDLGINWECGNFVTLTSDVDGSSRHFCIVGCEGSKPPHTESTLIQGSQSETKSPRPVRSLQWISGTLHGDQSEAGSISPKMSLDFGGLFDHGVLYAVNSFYDPVSGKQIAWGWVTEDDLPQELVDRQGWSGMLSVPRELSLLVLQNVTGALKSKLNEISSIQVEQDSTDTFTIRTLGIKPADSLQSLRQGTREIALSGPITLDQSSDSPFMDVRTHRFELKASLSVSDSCSSVGISIFHTEDLLDLTRATTIVLKPGAEPLTIRRPVSMVIDSAINTRDECAPFTLFSLKTNTGHEREKLEIHAFFDESVLEVFANGRTTIATRVYPASKTCFGIRFWAEDSGQKSRLWSATAWDGLKAGTAT